MTRSALLQSWFLTPPLGGKWTILWIIAALPIAALIRFSMDCPDMIGDCCTPLFLFVLLTATLLGWMPAVIAALASAIVSAWLSYHHGHHMHQAGGELWGMIFFALYCGVIIGAVEFMRRSLARFARVAGSHESSSGIIFSLEKGHAWASWPGDPSPVRLGPQDEVAEMMQDFIAQVELGQRLATCAGNAHFPSDESVPVR